MKLLALAIAVYWIATVLQTLVNLAVVPRLPRRRPRRGPLVSAIIPARDEERSIGATVHALLEQTYESMEVIVVDDRSADRTGEILAGIAAADPRLIVVTGEEPPGGWLGKPWALHQGSLRARGELLLFVDADVHYEREAVAAAVAHIEESGAAMISILPRMIMRGLWESIAMPNLAILGFSTLPLWLANRTTIPQLGVGGGPGNLVRRSDYEAAGGHVPLQAAVVDDVGLARLLRKAGKRTELVRADGLVSIRMYHGLREIVHGFSKNAFATFDRSWLMLLLILPTGMLFHGMPYLLAALGEPVGLVALAALLASRLILFASLGYSLLSALFGHVPMMLIWFWILARSAWLTGVRRQLVWRGRSYDADRTRFGD